MSKPFANKASKYYCPTVLPTLTFKIKMSLSDFSAPPQSTVAHLNAKEKKLKQQMDKLVRKKGVVVNSCAVITSTFYLTQSSFFTNDAN